MDSFVPVHDLKLEAAVLNRFITDRHADLQLLQLLNDSCFYNNDHKQLFHALVSLESKGLEIDMVSVCDELFRTHSQQQTTELVSRTATDVFASDELLRLDYMVVRLQEYAKRRALSEVSRLLYRLQSDMTYDLEQGISDVQEQFDKTIMGSSDCFVSLDQTLEELRKVVIENQQPETLHTGLLCGIPQIDDSGGLPADGVVVIGARSSHGKTTFSTNVAVNALKDGRKVVFYSMEMTLQKVTSRILSMECGVSSNAIRRLKLSQYELERVQQTIDQLQASIASQFFFDNRQIHDLDSLVMSIRALKKSRGVDCVVVDYLQLMSDAPGKSSENTTKLFGGIARTLHQLGQSLGVTILLLSQINRSVVGEPNMSQLRDSGEIAEAADMVIILYNAQFEHNTFSKPFENVDPKDKLLVKIEKSRDDARTSFLVGFNAAETRIYPLSHINETTYEQSIF